MRNWRTMAVFLGPRQTMAEEREGRRRAREMAWREPIFWRLASSFGFAVSASSRWGGVLSAFVSLLSVDGAAVVVGLSRACVSGVGGGFGMGGRVCEGWT